jgi:hypothetical protein
MLPRLQFGQIKHFRPFDTTEGEAIWDAIGDRCRANGKWLFDLDALGDTFELKQAGAEPMVFKNPHFFLVGKTDEGLLADGKEKEILLQIKRFYVELIQDEKGDISVSKKGLDLLDLTDQLCLDIAHALANGKEETVLPQIQSFSGKLKDHLNEMGMSGAELLKGKMEPLYQNVAQALVVNE